MGWVNQVEIANKINDCILSKGIMHIFLNNMCIDITPKFYNGKCLIGISHEGSNDFECTFKVSKIIGFGFSK